ncbi:MAG: DUF370 domain-containing protein [Clostridia bacterium]|nr:DUF370 domain-containing protein [Clostridia bacterium]
MYLHLGNDVVVDLKTVVGIFDMDNTTVSYQTRNFLAAAQKDGIVIDVTEDLPKSFIVTEENGKTSVYISSLASRTLYGRAKSDNIII